MRIIGFGLLSCHNLYPLFASLSFVLRKYSLTQMTINSDYPLNNKAMFLTSTMFLSELLVGLFDCSLYARKKYKTKNVSKDENGKVVDQHNIFELVKPKQTSKINNYLIIMLVILIEAGCFYSKKIIESLDDSLTNTSDIAKCLKLICDSLFCYLFFKYKVQRHQVFSILLLIVGVTLSFIPEFIDESGNYYFIFYFLVSNSLLSLRDCFEKLLMENKFYGPVRLLFIKGVIGTVLTLMILFIMKGAKCSMKYCEDIYKICSIIFSGMAVSLFFALFSICSAVYNLFCNLIKAHYNPAYISVSDCMSLMIIEFIIQIYGRTSLSSIKFIISGVLLILLGSIVYNEIIIIYLCQLHTYTKKEISERSERENYLTRILDIDETIIE